MNIFVLTAGDRRTASSYYRIFQYEELFKKEKIGLQWSIAKEFIDFQKLKYFDCVILQKTILSKNKIKKIAAHSKNFLYDCDDRIWLSHTRSHHLFTRLRLRTRLRVISSLVRTCMVPNSVISKDLEEFGAKTTIVPMALDGNLWSPPTCENKKLMIGWAGAPHNLVYLDSLLPVIRGIQKKYPGLDWVIYSGKNPNFSNIKYRFIPFQSGHEHKIIRNFDIGLLPLIPNDFAEGKSPIKALQYLATQTAIVATPTKVTREILQEKGNCLFAENPGQWDQALEQLIIDSHFRKTLAHQGRLRFEEHFSLEQVYPLVKNTIINY
jgi:glycosyltransferase involved in cell wall biosynthesis